MSEYPSSPENREESILDIMTLTLEKMFQPTYDVYFTDRRVIFAKIGDLVVYDSILSALADKADQMKRTEYAKMSLQQIADARDCVAVPYEEVESIVVRGRMTLKMSFRFSRKQKGGWEKATFILWGMGGKAYDQRVKKTRETLRKFFPNKLDIQIESPKLLATFREQ